MDQRNLLVFKDRRNIIGLLISYETNQIVNSNRKRVAITGAASGIGLETAKTLLEANYRVAVCDSDPNAVAQVNERFNGGITAISADVSNPDQVDEFFDAVLQQFGGLDVLINNAGIAGPTASVEDISLNDWRRCIDICLTGMFLCTRRSVPALKSAGGGAIINMSSVAGKFGYAFRTPYSSAKFAVIGFTESLAKELGPSNIRVNAILPGIVEGERIRRVIKDRAAKTGESYSDVEAAFVNSTSLRRMVEAKEVASAIAYLVSDSGKGISGQSLAVDGNVEGL